MPNKIISPLNHEDTSQTGLDYDTSRQPTPFFTFGVEFEMMPAVLAPDDQRPVPRFEEPARSIDSYTDSDASVAEHNAEGIYQHRDTKTHHRNIALLLRRLLRLYASDKYALLYDLRDIEISSPAFVYNEDAIAEVRKFCEIMRNNYRVYTAGQSASSIHVHVGAGSSGFSFETLRNIAAIIWAFGPQLEELYALQRTKSVHCKNLWSNTTLSNIFQLKIGKDGANISPHLIHGLNMIKETKTVSDIIGAEQNGGLLSKGGQNSLAYKFNNLSEGRSVTPKTAESKRTIEFRQHEGSLDPEEIEQWVAVCVGIVHFADLVKSDKLFSFLKSCLTRQKLSTADVLEALKMPMAAYFWGKKIQKRVQESDSSVSGSVASM